MPVKDYLAHPLLAAEALADIECALCVAPVHPLARRPAVTPNELHAHVELLVQESSGRGDDRHRFGGERVFYPSGFETKKRALLMGLGFGWVPLYLVADVLRAGRMRGLRYVAGSRYRFTPLIVRRVDAPLGRTGTRLAALLRGQRPVRRVRREARSAR